VGSGQALESDVVKAVENTEALQFSNEVISLAAGGVHEQVSQLMHADFHQQRLLLIGDVIGRIKLEMRSSVFRDRSRLVRLQVFWAVVECLLVIAGCQWIFFLLRARLSLVHLVRLVQVDRLRCMVFSILTWRLLVILSTYILMDVFLNYWRLQLLLSRSLQGNGRRLLDLIAL